MDWILDLLFGTGHATYALGPLAALGISAGAGMLSGWMGGNAQKKAQKHTTSQAWRAANLSNPGTPEFRLAYQAMQENAAPWLNQIMAGQALAGQNAAYGAQAGLGRAGLGTTGLGASLGAGLQAGAAFQGNQLRARLMQDLLGMTMQNQQHQGQLITGVAANAQPVTSNWFTGALQGTGSMLAGLDAIGAFDKKSDNG